MRTFFFSHPSFKNHPWLFPKGVFGGFLESIPGRQGPRKPIRYSEVEISEPFFPLKIQMPRVGEVSKRVPSVKVLERAPSEDPIASVLKSSLR